MPKKVLLVEDEEYLVELLKFRLEKKGYDVETALNGSEGLRKASDVKPDIIILDIMLPGMDGYEVCRAIKQDSATKEIPVIFLTARAHEDDQNVVAEYGAAGFLTKPFESNDLIQEIERVLGK